MNSISISIEAGEETQEILISQLMDLGAQGFEQTGNHLLAYFPEMDFNSYEVNGLLKDFNHQVEIIQEQNWNEVWEKNFEPVVVEGFCVVRADFHAPMPQIPFEILITPKMSFGTGHHATTYMMMDRMRDLELKGKTVFDFGTGTGILAILAEKMGAEQIIATDNDQWSISNAAENLEKNDCTRTELMLSEKIPGTLFDVILANINRNVILENLAQLRNALKPGGLLLLSGLLQTDEDPVLQACEREQLRLLKKAGRNNWISLLLVV